MRGLLKRLLVLYICVLLISNGVYNFVLAQDVSQDCPSCFTTPQNLYKYINSIKSILNTINTRGAYSLTASSSSSKYSSEGDIITETGKKIERTGEKAAGAGKSAYESVKMSGVLTKTMTAGFDDEMMGNYKVIFNTDVAIRDWKLLIALDRLIADKAFKIGAANLADKIIPKKDVDIINSNLKDLGPLGDVSIKSATYEDLIGLIWDTNSFYKNVYLEFTYSNVKGVDHEKNMQEMYKYYNVGFELNFTKAKLYDYMDMMKNEYKCSTQQNICPGGWSEFKKSLDKILNFSTKDANKSYEKVQKSIERLRQAMQKVSGGNKDDTKSFEDRKKRLLLRTQGRNATEVIGYTGTWGVGKMWDKVKDDVVNPGLSMVDDVDNKLNQYFRKEVDLAETSQVHIENYTQQYVRAQFKQDMSAIIDGVYALQDKKTTDVVMESPAPVTSMFPQLSKKVYEGLLVIGNRDKEGSIAKNMGEACEKQCSNFGGECRADN